ncbi:MAG: c-type cytochrome [Phototrophicaceae bacterium]
MQQVLTWRFRLIGIAVGMGLLVGCASQTLTYSDLPTGNPEHGAQLFGQQVNGAPSCSSCHVVEGADGVVAPSLAGVASVATNRQEGYTAEGYLLNSIVNPADHLVEGYANLMYTEYQRKLSTQDLADLVAYLSTLR